MVTGECVSTNAPEGEVSPEVSIKTVQPPAKLEVLMGGVCPEEEVKPLNIKPQVLGKICLPSRPVE